MRKLQLSLCFSLHFILVFPPSWYTYCPLLTLVTKSTTNVSVSGNANFAVVVILSAIFRTTHAIPEPRIFTNINNFQ